MIIQTMLNGCSLLSGKTDKQSQIAEALDNLRESKFEYEVCENDQVYEPELDCDYLKEMYDDDKVKYDKLVKTGK